MSRSALSRCVAALTLILCLSALAPAWASGNTHPPSAPAPAAVQHAGALTTLWTWLQMLVGKAGGHHFVIDKGCANDPNGLTCGGAGGGNSPVG
jgi:hypothetical protein